MATQHWERLGAASGIVAAILFGVSFIIFLGNDPSDLPDVLHAADYAEFVREHQDALKVQVLLNSLGIVLFLWFLGSLWSRLRAAEGGPARVSAIASAGGIAGAVAVLMGFVFEACAAVAPTTIDVTTLYVMATMSIGLGAAAFTVFFLAIARVIFGTGARFRWRSARSRSSPQSRRPWGSSRSSPTRACSTPRPAPSGSGSGAAPSSCGWRWRASR